jgi:hypothetical protein
MSLEKALFGGAIISTILFIILSATGNTELIENDSWLIEETCLEGTTHEGGISHIHSSLSIFIDDSEVTLSKNIGIQDSECPEGMRGIHTHDESGTLHIETPNQIDAPIGAFFNIWGETFNSEQILDNTANSEYDIEMRVNGVINEEYENYVMLDGDNIEIYYKQK